MKTRLLWITPEAEKVILYCARVSNPKNQDSENTKLISYCIQNNHWSVFEMASACFEIETSRAITAQILRHSSFHFQEFSQRYAETIGCETYRARRQDTKNRQNSIDDFDKKTLDWFEDAQKRAQRLSTDLYREAITKGIAKEQARFLLPMSSSSKIYMSGTIRSWIHYLALRTGNGTQKEHQDIALSIREALAKNLPTISETLGWK